MVTCKLMGGLGNQMFQIATTIGYSEKYDVPFFLPETTMDEAVWKHYFLVDKTEVNTSKWLVYRENEKQEYRSIGKFDKVVLSGWFQSYRYFDNAREKVLKAFSVSGEMLKGIVSIHVRRGDYLLNPELFPVATERYLTESVNHLKNLGYDKFLVFSDDFAWCMNFFKGDEYQFYTCRTDVEDLHVMSKCEHNIIANSSFSWWAAYLNSNPDKIVIAPKKWFHHRTMRDICPLNWIRL